MDVEILIHGVPDGQDYYGIKEEQTNMGLFYDSSKESVKYVVETKIQGKNTYAYYSYLRYKGMIGSGGRPGSYFGITLRIDMYYQDALHIYSLLDIAFKRYIIGTLLVPSGDAYKYATANFATKTADIGKFQQVLFQLIQTTCLPSKFLDIDASFIHPISAFPSANIADVSDAAILASMKKYSKVVLSPDYELNIEKDYKKKLQEAEGKGGNLVAEKDKKIAEKDSTIASLNTKVTTQQNQITTLEQESKRKDTEIQQLKQSGNLAKLVSNIKEPIVALAEYFHVQDSQKRQPSPKYGHKNFRLGILSCSLLVIILVLCVVTLFRSPADSSTDVVDLNKQIKTLTIENTQLKKDIKSKDKIIADLKAMLPQTPVQTTLTIVVDGYASGQKISTDKTYTVSVRNGNNKYDNGKGIWTLTNAQITGTKTNAQIKFKPQSDGLVKLEYKPNDANYKCDAITIQAEKPAQTTINLRIDVADYTTGKLSTDKTYTVTVKKGNQKYDNGKGKWIITNADINKGKDTDAQITIKPDGKGKVTLEYKASDNNYKCESRSIDIEKPQQQPQPVNEIEFSIVITPQVKEVEIGEIYTFTISGYDGKGKWSFDGFEPQRGTYTDKKIEVKAKKGSKGYSIAKYVPDGGKEQSLEFNYKAKETQEE